MSKRSSPEEAVVLFFQSAPFDVANTVYRIVRGLMKRRSEEEEIVHGVQGSSAQAKPRKRAKRKVHPSTVPANGEATDEATA